MILITEKRNLKKRKFHPHTLVQIHNQNRPQGKQKQSLYMNSEDLRRLVTCSFFFHCIICKIMLCRQIMLFKKFLQWYWNPFCLEIFVTITNFHCISWEKLGYWITQLKIFRLVDRKASQEPLLFDKRP